MPTNYNAVGGYGFNPYDPRRDLQAIAGAFTTNHVLVVNDSILVLCTSNTGAVWYNTRAKTFTVQGFRYVRTAAGTDSLAGTTWCHKALLLDRENIWIPVVHGNSTYIADAITGELRSSLTSLHPFGRAPTTNGMVLGDRLIGNVGFWRDPEVGFVLDQAFTGRGYAFEATQAVLANWV